MTFSIVGTAAAVATTSYTTRTITLPTGIAAGDTVFLLGVRSGGAATLVLTDGSYTQIGQHSYSGHNSELWYKQNAQSADSGAVLTVTSSAAARYSLFAVVVRGLSATAALDGHSDFISATGEGGTAQPGNSKVASTFTTTASDVLLQFAAVTGGVTAAPAAMTFIHATGVTLAIDGYDTNAGGDADGAIFYNSTTAGSGTSLGGNTFTTDATTGSGNWTIYTVGATLAVSGGQDTVRPTSVVSNTGSWTNQGGAASINAALADETDATFAQSPTITAGPYALEVGIAQLNTGIPTITYRAALSAVGSQTLTVKLKQGATVIATWTDTITSTTATDFSHTCTSGQAATITDYSALSVDFEAS